MSATRKDRKQIESLHEMSLSDTGPLLASSKWDGPPVTIAAPYNEPRRHTRASNYDPHMHSANSRDRYNPFQASRTRTTLAPTTTLGKRASGSDLRSSRTTSPSACTRKKVKVDRKSKPSLGPEIIDLDTERRDTSSPDPLNNFGSTNGVADHLQSSRSAAVASTSRLPPDGAATNNLKRVLQDTRASSPIEEFEDDKPKQSVALDPDEGNVKRLVSQYENRTLEDMHNGPTIDLRKVGKTVNVKSKMKPKTSWDPVATSSSNFTQKGCIIKTNEDYTLPVKACVIDQMLISEDTTTGLVLAWSPSGGVLTLSCKPNEAVAALDTGSVDYIEYAASTTPSRNFDGMPVLKIHMERMPSLHRLRRGSAVHLRPSLVTIMLDSGTGKWSTKYMDSFLNWLKRHSVATQSSRNGQQMWEMALREVNAPDQDQDQDSGHVQEDKGLRISDIRPTSETKSESNEPSAEKSDRPIRPRRSSRNVIVTIKKPRPPVDPDEVILVYPQGLPGAINITNADVSRLQPGEFLNDTVIEFGLKLWHRELESSNPEFAKDVHVFSSFFYKKLHNRNFEEGYQSVRKWTSKFNLFDKKYIIIPINENLHWYLAIIYMPHYMLQPPPLIPTKPTPSSRTRSRASKAANEAESPKSPATDSLSTATASIAEAEDQLKNGLDEFQKSCTITVTEGLPTLDVMDVVPSHSEGHDGDRPLQPTDECAMDVDKSEEDAVQEQLRADSIFSDDTPSNLDDMEIEAEIPSEPLTSRFFSDNFVKKSVIELNSQGQQTSGDTGPIPERRQEDIQEELDDQVPENDDEQGDGQGLSPSTYIFTLDSLGTRHLQATKQLNKYLKMEASHKLNNSDTSDAIGKAVPVPTQPNFCDCGIYLLHFARTFMTDPAKYFQTINTSKKPPPASDRKAIWQDHKVGTMRQELTERIKELSDEWKKTRQEAKRDQAETLSDTDSEIEYVETAPAPAQAKTKTLRSDGKRYKAGRSSRMRG
ncbi:hypothetical protein JOM56_010526 [Amanita muscaria]